MKKHLLTLVAFSLILSACSKKESTPESTIDATELTLNYDKEHQFSVKQGNNDIDESTYVWKSSDVTIGTIETSGLFKGKRIGKTTVTATKDGKTLTSQITINPYSTLFTEPYIDFTFTKANVKSKETRTLATGGEDATSLMYNGENTKISNIFYSFKNNLLEGSIVVFNTANIVPQDFGTFYLERYTLVGDDDDTVYFAKGSTLVAIGETTGIGFTAIYVKNTNGAVANISLKEAKILIEQKSIELKEGLK
ncbi:MAG: Ig-like domain-containing protein [Pedobacter sp.]